MEVLRDDERWYDLLLHDLSDGCLEDRVAVGPFDSNGSESIDGGPVGVANGRAVTYIINGEERIVEVYSVTKDGKLKLQHTLDEPTQVPSKGRISTYVEGRPAAILLKCTSEAVITASLYCGYPSSVRLTRWSSDSRLSDHRTVEFVRDLDAPHSQQESHIRGHTSIDFPLSKALVIASYERILEEDDSQPVTIIRSFDSSTLALQWSTVVPQMNSTLHFIQQRNMILAFGIAGVAGESHPLGRVGLTARDAATGAIHSTHTLPDPQRPGGHIAGILGDANLTSSGGQLVLVFGDGQIAIFDISGYLDNGFDSVTNAEGKINTHPFPETPLSTPKNKKERKIAKEGYWCWVDKVYYGDGQVILQPWVGGKKPTGFAVVSWK